MWPKSNLICLLIAAFAQFKYFVNILTVRPLRWRSPQLGVPVRNRFFIEYHTAANVDANFPQVDDTKLSSAGAAWGD
jgi:hypothetical protein